MSAAYFITGTDTDVGKTTIAAGLLQAARSAGLSTAAGKPVASGCDVLAGIRVGGCVGAGERETDSGAASPRASARRASPTS